MSVTGPLINQPRLEALLRELVRIPSENPPGAEEGVAAYISEYLGQHGLAVHSQEALPGRHNVVGWIPTDVPRPKLVFNGHMDVVPAPGKWSMSPYEATVKGRRLYGRGSADMKGGVAAMIEAAIAIHEAGVGLRGRLEVHAVVDEEVGQGGTRALVEDGLKADFAVVCEPTTLRPYIASKGSYYYEIVTKGRAVHASVPSHGRNAIEHMAAVINGLMKLTASLDDKHHALLGSPTLVVSTIVGGFVTCAVPDECRITLDRRVLPDEGLDIPDRELQAVLDACRDAIPGFDGELRVIQKALPMEISADEPIVQGVLRAAARVTGLAPEVGGFSAVSDANWLVNAAGIPTVILGPGDIADAHTVDESIDLDQVAVAAQIYVSTAVDLLH